MHTARYSSEALVQPMSSLTDPTAFVYTKLSFSFVPTRMTRRRGVASAVLIVRAQSLCLIDKFSSPVSAKLLIMMNSYLRPVHISAARQ